MQKTAAVGRKSFPADCRCRSPINPSSLNREFSRVFLYNASMRFIFVLLAIAAALLTVLIVGLTIVSILSGGGSVLFPGLGLVVSLPFLILLLALFDALLIILALLIKRMSEKYSGEKLK